VNQVCLLKGYFVKREEVLRGFGPVVWRRSLTGVCSPQRFCPESQT